MRLIHLRIDREMRKDQKDDPKVSRGHVQHDVRWCLFDRPSDQPLLMHRLPFVQVSINADPEKIAIGFQVYVNAPPQYLR